MTALDGGSEAPIPGEAKPPVFVRCCAAALTVLLLILSCRMFPPYWEQYLYQTTLLILGFVVLAEGAIRQRFIFFNPIYGLMALGFACTVVISYFGSELDKYETSPVAVTRLLWLVPLYVSCLIWTQDPKIRRAWLFSVAAAMILMAWRTAQVEGDEGERLVGAAAAGVVGSITGWMWKPRTGAKDGFPRHAGTILLFSLLTAALLVAVWAGLTKLRLGMSEVDLVRQGRQTERAAVSVAERSFKEHWASGAGHGSFPRMFLRYRPAEATMQGVPDRLTFPMQSFAVLAAETGSLGLILFLAMMAVPWLLNAGTGPPIERAVVTGIYGFFLVHEAWGGGWSLTHAGGLSLFCVLGILVSRDSPCRERGFPSSLFWACLTVIGGIFLLQQIYWQKTHEIEQIIKETKALIKTGKLSEAADLADRGLGQVDKNRNELLSYMIGAMHSAGMINQALQNSHALLARDPDYPAVKNNIATFYMLLNRPAEALPFIKESAERHPVVENFARLGHICMVVGDLPAAQKTFSDAIALFPREIDVFMARSPAFTDTRVQGKMLLESAAFCANSLIRFHSNANNPQAARQVVDAYRAESTRLKKAIGMP